MRRSLPIALMLAIGAATPSGAWALHPGAPVTHGPDTRAIDVDRLLTPRASARAARRPAGASSRLPARWCGDARTGDDSVNELDNGTYRFHAVYAHPRDRASRLHEVAGRIQSGATGASELIEALHGRAIRFDMGTRCGPAYLDISVLRLPQTSAELERLAATPEGTLDAVARALDSAGFPVIGARDTRADAAARKRNWVVWLDGPAPDGACGQAMLYDDPQRSARNANNLGGKVAIVFRRGGSFCGASTVRHEIGHNLGAVVSHAPHASGGHCTDALEDTMCLAGSPQRAGGEYHARWFDYGNDDYWDPPGGALPWWTVNLNRFLCRRADCNVPPGHAASVAGRGASSRLDVKARAARYARNRWRLRIRVRGSGPALVSVRCRRPGERRSAVIWRRDAEAPDRLGVRVRCATYPRTRVEAPGGAYSLLRARRRRGNRWAVDLRVRGRGRAEVVIRCRRSRGGRVESVWRRRSVAAPRRYRLRLRCASRPRTSSRTA